MRVALPLLPDLVQSRERLSLDTLSHEKHVDHLLREGTDEIDLVGALIYHAVTVTIQIYRVEPAVLIGSPLEPVPCVREIAIGVHVGVPALHVGQHNHPVGLDAIALQILHATMGVGSTTIGVCSGQFLIELQNPSPASPLDLAHVGTKGTNHRIVRPLGDDTSEDIRRHETGDLRPLRDGWRF